MDCAVAAADKIADIKKASRGLAFFALQANSGIEQAKGDQAQPENCKAENKVRKFFHQQFIDFFQHACVS
ncbi:MAG: hypothetical protein Kow0083_11100 [Methylophaga sp.]